MNGHFPLAVLACCLAAVAIPSACSVWDGVTLPTDGGSAADANASSEANAYATQVRADEPIAYWRFAAFSNESARTVDDVTGHGKVCELSSNTALVAGPLRGGRSVRISDGDAVACAAPSDPTLGFVGRAPFSFEFFVAPGAKGPPAAPEFRQIFDRMMGDNASNRRGYFAYMLRKANEDTWTIAFEHWRGEGAPETVSAVETIATGAWVHVVITRDSTGRLSLYLDGTRRAETAASDSVETSGVRLIVGRNQNRSCCSLLGDIAELAVYGKALGIDDVERHVAAARTDGFVPR